MHENTDVGNIAMKYAKKIKTIHEHNKQLNIRVTEL